MFSRRTLLIAAVVVLAAVNIIFLSVSSRNLSPNYDSGNLGMSLAGPLQNAVVQSVRFCRQTWQHYFALVDTAEENQRLQQALRESRGQIARMAEVELANQRLRALLGFYKGVGTRSMAAQVIARDPTPWFRTVIVDKGRTDGLQKGMPVVVPEGVVGQVVAISDGYARVLLITDPNNAVDALVQRSRARGIVSGGPDGACQFKYVLRKEDVRLGDHLVTSGLDRVFPKGLRVGMVSGLVRRHAGIFQEVAVSPAVDFDKLEEVLVVLTSPASPQDAPES